MTQTYISELPRLVGDTVTLRGWIMTTRSSGKIACIVLRDGSGSVQGVLSRREVTDDTWALFLTLAQESSVAVTGVVREDTRTGATRIFPTQGVVLAIGHKPNTELLGGQLALDQQGYVVTEAGSPRTSVDGVFACGDVQDHVYRQAVTAAGSGCMAAIEAERWLAEHGA